MDTKLSRGAAVAILALGGALPAGAQGGGVPPRPVDTTTVRVVMPGGKPTRDGGAVHFLLPTQRISLDSLAVLMEAFEHVPVGSPALVTLRSQIDKVARELVTTKIMFNAEPMPSAKLAIFPKGWIGINALGPRSRFTKPNGLYEEYYDYQPIVSVDPESPAQRAGVSPGDVLVAYNGVDLRGHVFNLTEIFAPDRKLSVTIRREGEMKDFSMTVAKVPENVFIRRRDLDAVPMGDVRVGTALRGAMGGAGGMHGDEVIRLPFAGAVVSVHPSGGSGGPPGSNFVYRIAGQDGVFGAKILTLSSELAKKLRLEAGLLVDDVPEETPAYKSGLRTGDVIVAAGGQQVTSLKKLLELVVSQSSERTATLTVIRDNKPRRVTVIW